MKLVEVVILTGVHCISPIQNTPVKTDVTKVWCAVVVEKDTVAARIQVTPAAALGNPAVRVAVQRLQSDAAPVPKSAMLTGPPVEERSAMPVPDAPDPAEPVKLSARVEVTVPKPLPRPAAIEAAEADAAEPQADVVAAVEEPPPPDVEPEKKPATEARKRSSQCSGASRPVWYTNKEGRRKYRCRRPGSTAKLY